MSVIVDLLMGTECTHSWSSGASLTIR